MGVVEARVVEPRFAVCAESPNGGLVVPGLGDRVAWTCEWL